MEGWVEAVTVGRGVDTSGSTIFLKKLQTQPINKNINSQHRVSFGQVSEGFANRSDLSSLKEFPAGRAGSAVAFHIS